MAADDAKRESQTNYTMLDGDEVLDGTSYSTHMANEMALANSYEEECEEETRRRRGGGVVLNRQSNDVSIQRASSLASRSSISGCKLGAGDGAEGSGRFESNEQVDGGEEETRGRRGSGIAKSDTDSSDFPERSASFVLRNASQNNSAVERHQPEWTGTR
jgi:hypothetical protein